MKRLFTYILALSLLPQIASAATVGKTEGTFAVSPTGAATYTIPLKIQKGMSDFMPNLSLVYDSQASNGLMGLGWSIKGLSSISAIIDTQHFGGSDDEITPGADNAYALDGMRLLLKSGTNGHAGAVYKTVLDQSNIISITDFQNGTPATFQIKSKDGATYKYGSTTGRFSFSGGDAYQWALDYAEDALGNYISYTYSLDGFLYPTSITYGCNTHGTAGTNCVISFTYEDRPDNVLISAFQNIENHYITKRLKKIECKYNGRTYKAFSFGYEDGMVSRLTYVAEEGIVSSSYYITRFNWGNVNNQYEQELQKIVSVTDGLGAVEHYSYGTERRSHIPVIISRTESIPSGSKTTNYSYEYGVENDAWEICGFLNIREESSTGIVKEINNVECRDACTILPYQIVTKGTDGEIIKIEDYSSNVDVANDYSYTINSSNHNLSNYNEEFQKDSICYYENGILTSYETREGNYSFSLNKNVEITNWECPNSNIYIKGLPSEIEITKSSDYEDAYETITYERDPNTGLVLKEIKTRNDEHVKTDGYSYNVYGQMTHHYTVAFESEDTLVTSFEYDTYGRLKKEYNPLGQYKSYTYDSYGRLSSFCDFNGVTSTYKYDNMGREIKCESPLKVVTTTRSTADHGGSVYSVKVVESGKAPTITYYDAWERKVAESVNPAYGTTVYTDYRYNSLGLLEFVSFPHKITEADTLGTWYTYEDPALKLTKTEDSNGKINTWEYEPLGIMKSCIDGKTTKFHYYTPDLLKVVVDGDDYNSSLQCSYNVDGNLDDICVGYWDAGTNGGDYTTDYEYDTFGRLVQITDLNGVTKQYEYDANGYPKKTTIGGSTVITNYDKYGRLLSKTWTGSSEGSHTVTYTYNTDVKKKHLVAQEQGDNYTYTYTYDTNGKLTNKRQSVTDGTQTHYVDIAIQYNSDKQISKKTCTFSIGNRRVVEAFSYKNGGLQIDSLNNNVAWRLLRMDSRGNVITDRGTSAACASTYSFDDYGHMLSLQNSRLTDRSYIYDIETGNMTEENDIPLTYDDKNRLTEWGDHVYEYDEKGNIIYQPLVGRFTYDDFKVIRMVENSNYTADDSLGISYYKAIERPKSIENKHYKADFSYDGEGNRVLMQVYKKVSGQYQPYLTRFYLDKNIEVNVDSLGSKKIYYYAGDDAQTSPAVMLVQGSSYQTWTMVRDNTGSVVGYLKGSSPVHEFSYNPWGVRTAVDDVTDFSLPGEPLGDCPFYRTHKGYEDLWMFGLQFDKTRLYSPYMGRYLSPNPMLNTTGSFYDNNPYVFSGDNPFRVVK